MEKDSPKTSVQILSVLSGSLIRLSDGMQFGWTSPILPLLTSPSSYIPVQESDVSLIENIYQIGALFGLIVSVLILDIIGRKRTLIMVSVLSLLVWLLLGLSTSVNVLAAARFLGGVTFNMVYIANAAYIGEVTDKTIRGRLVSLLRIMLTGGTLLIYCIGPYVSILTSSMIGFGIILVFLSTFSFAPESPYFFLMKNQKEKARKSLQTLRQTGSVEEELESIQKTIETESRERRNALDLIRIKTNRRAYLIVVVLTVSQQFSGFPVLYMNVHTIIANSSTNISSNLAAITYSTLMLIMHIFSGLLLDKVGRKTLICLSCLSTSTVLFLLAIYFVLQNSVNIESFEWVAVALIMLYALTYSMGMALVPSVLAAELFPTNIKSVGISACSAAFVISGCISMFLYHWLKNNFGIYVPFFLYSFCTLFVAIFSYFFVPETKNKTLNEIQILLADLVYEDKILYMALIENDD